MILDRRHFVGATAASALLMAADSAARAAPLTSALGRDATQAGIKPNSSDDQTAALQRAIDTAAAARVPLALPPGLYRTGALRLPDGAQLVGTRGATRLAFMGGPSLFESEGASYVTLDGLTLDGNGVPLPQRRGLVHCLGARNLRISDCEIIGSGASAIWLEKSGGAISGNTLSKIALTGVVSFDAAGLSITQNAILGTNNNGIEIIRSSMGDDGTIVTGNRIENIKAGLGGSGQYGNAINAFRAGNVIVSGNRIKDCDFSAVRGNSASNIQITNNTVSDVREVALYSEFVFEGAVIANNIVDGAAIGVSVCNFMQGGRLCTVQGNLIRNIKTKRPAGTDPGDAAGVGIYVEADTAVTGNVVEKCPLAGIMAGWGQYLRDVTITGNVVRDSFIGIGVSVSSGAGTATVSGNSISGVTRGAVIGLDHARPATPELLAANAPRFAQLALGVNTLGANALGATGLR